MAALLRNKSSHENPLYSKMGHESCACQETNDRLLKSVISNSNSIRFYFSAVSDFSVSSANTIVNRYTQY